MRPQRRDELRLGSWRVRDGLEKALTVCPAENHSLMILEDPTSSFVREIASRQSRYRTGLLDQPTD
jgi:hypothetical protein